MGFGFGLVCDTVTEPMNMARPYEVTTLELAEAQALPPAFRAR